MRTTPGSISVGKIQDQKGQFLRDYKAERGCMDCGEMDVVVLQFDHRNSSEKDPRLRARNQLRGGVSWVGLSWEDIRTELTKCDVVCANCHLKRGAKRKAYN